MALYSDENYRYKSIDITVAGTSTSDLKLFLVGAYTNLADSKYYLFVDKFDANSYVYLSRDFEQQKGTRPISDVSMATDYRFPANVASPYSVAFVYSIFGSNDSINYVASIDGGGSWPIFQNIATTGSYFFRKVSLSYGRSTSGSNGRYFAAWEQIETGTSRTGHIYTSRSSSTISDPWITPINLDSTSANTINLCRNPSISSQFNAMDNDSFSVTSIVLFEKDYNGNGTDYDIMGYYNKRSHFTNYWNIMDVNVNMENDMFPDISYDPVFNNFLAVYMDSTNKRLPFIVTGMNLLAPITWITMTNQFNDNPNITYAYPKVEINSVENKVAHVWVADTDASGNNGVVMFDAEYKIPSAVDELTKKENSAFKIYPNPARNIVNVEINVEKRTEISIEVCNIFGKIIQNKNISIDKILGKNIEKFDVSNWSDGIYLFTIKSNDSKETKRITIIH